MNQRIQELAQMCWEELDEEEGYYPEFNSKKFAELIVAECVSKLAWAPQSSGPEGLSEYNQGWVNGRALAVEHIKEHFGLDS